MPVTKFFVKFNFNTLTLSLPADSGSSSFTCFLLEKSSVTKISMAFPLRLSPYLDWMSLYELISALPEYQYDLNCSVSYNAGISLFWGEAGGEHPSRVANTNSGLNNPIH